MSHLIIQYRAPSVEVAGLADASPSEWLPPWTIGGAPDLDQEQDVSPELLVSGEARLPLVEAGDDLIAGEVYLDLRTPSNGPFVALEGQRSGSGNAYVAQGELPSPIWNELVRVCARAGEAVQEAVQNGLPCTVEIVIDAVEHHEQR